MKKTKVILLSAIITLGLIGSASAAYARGGNGGGNRDGSCGGTPKRDGSGRNAQQGQNANCPYVQK